MKEKLLTIWHQPLITTDGDTFTVGQVITTFAGIVAGLIVLGVCGKLELVG